MTISAPARLAADLRALVGDHRTARLGVAVSGGPDSLALLLLAATIAPGRVAAATVDHGLRPESATEAAMVAELSESLGIPHATLRPAMPITGSLQARARAVRYALLERWRTTDGLDWVLTAHHADDQAETLLMRLNRGAGVGGLAGIRAVNGHVVRPVLGWRRAELAAVVDAAGIEPIDDPSNRDVRYDRARLRIALRDAEWFDARAFATSAAHLADAQDALGWMTARLGAERLSGDTGSVRFDPAGLPPELVRRLLLTALGRLEPGLAPSGPELDRLIATLSAGWKASIGGLLGQGGTVWTIVPAPPRRT